jgi:acetolactate synthase-1/2/3 large subunit
MDWAPDFVKLAQAYGAEGYRVTDPAQVRPVLAQAFGNGKPTIVDVVVSREENVYPMVPAGASLHEMLLV